MSGHKETRFSIHEAWLQHQRVLAEISSFRDELAGLRSCLARQTGQMSEGLKATFSQEYSAVMNWVAELDRARPAPAVLLDQQLARDLHRELDSLASTGRSVLERLSGVITSEASRLERVNGERLAHLETRLASCQESIQRWAGESEARSLAAALNDVQKLYAGQAYRGLTDKLTALLADIEARNQVVQELEVKHQRRLYVLTALRQVCHSMGFQELAEPAYERPADLRSRIIYIVDTLDRGRIKFHLGLEGIESDSGISRNHCHEQFDELSRHLSDQYGVITQFRSAEEGPDQVLRTYDEEDLPQSSGTGLEHV